MWIIYQKKDLKVVGLSALAEQDIDKAVAVEEVVKGLASSGALKNYDAVQVTDVAQAMAMVTTPLEHIAIDEDTRGRVSATAKAPRRSLLLVQCDAKDTHPVDGIPTIKADGVSTTIITAQKVDERGEPQKSRGDNDELYLRTTAGTLQSADGKELSSPLKLKQGQASFRLLADKAQRVATVSVFNADPFLQDGTIRIEFL